MAKPTLDTKKIQAYIDRRLKIIDSSIQSLSLGADNAVSVLTTFAKYLQEFVAPASANDASFFTTKFSEVFAAMIQPIPESELAATGITKLMHNKFTTLAQAVLAHPKCDQFFHAAIQDGCGTMMQGLKEFQDGMAGLQGTFIQHLTELEPYITLLKTNPDLAFKSVVDNNQPQITAMSKKLYLKLFELRANMEKYNNFASAKADEVYGVANELNTLLTGLSGLKSMPTSLGDLTNKIGNTGDVWTKGQDLFDKVDAIIDIESKIASEIDFNSLFNSNLTKVLANGRRIRNYCANLSSLLEQDVNAVVTAAQDVAGMLPYIQGLMKSMAQKNLVRGLGSGFNKDMFNDMKAQFTVLTKPLDELKTLQRDIQAVFAATKNLVKGIIPHSTAIPTLKARMEANFDAVKSYADTAMSIFGSYAPVLENVAKTAYQALKDTAPTPLKSLSAGDVTSFQKALINPLALTEIGPIMDEISEFLSDAEDLALEEIMVVNELMDFVSREHTREAISTYIADPDLQKAVAIAGLKKYAGRDLKYPAMLVDSMTNPLVRDAHKRLY